MRENYSAAYAAEDGMKEALSEEEAMAAIEAMAIAHAAQQQRSNRADVRNPVAADPTVAALVLTLATEHPAAAEALRAVLKALSKKWRGQAEHSWHKHKAPVAAYHKANAVNARHLALAIPRPPLESNHA